jgi:pimeloyl-ACP methyl ester carboxylesterase
MPAPLPELPGVTHSWVDVGGVRLHVAEAGEGEPIVLLHGWPEHWYAWRDVIPPLVAAGHRVIVPDLRGFGWSDAPHSGYRKDELAGDVVGLVEALDLDGVTLAGHDWGGLVAFFACLEAPSRFRGLLACSIVHPWANIPLSLKTASRAAYQVALAAPGLGAAIQARTPFIVKAVATSGFRWSDEEAEAFRAPLRDMAHARAASRVYRAFLLHERAEIDGGANDGKRLTVPARMLIGRDDPVVTEAALAGGEAHCDDLVIEWIEGAHWLPEEHPETVADRILRLAGTVRGEG